MKHNKIKGVDKPVARLLQGTVMLNTSTRDKNFELLDALFERGMRAFDTAHGYGSGQSESELGAWVADRGVRDEVVILTKGAHPYPPEEPERVTPAHIRSDIEESLERLQTDSVELYLLHRDNPDYPVGEIVDVLNEIHDKGYIGAFGGSNWTHHRVKDANDYAKANGKIEFAITSPQFGVADMVKPPWPNCISVSAEQGEEARAWYDENEIAVIPWSSLAGGFLTGKYTRDNLDQFDSYWDEVSIEAYAYEDNFKRLDRIKELADDKGASPAQISIAYVLNNNPRNHAIVANWDIDTIDDNLKALDITLSPAEVQYLELKIEDKPE